MNHGINPSQHQVMGVIPMKWQLQNMRVGPPLGVDIFAEQKVFHHGGGHMDDNEILIEDQDYMYPEDDEIPAGSNVPANRAVHQCNVCNKIFVSFKGLQQHAVIHTDQKPFQCDVCAKQFRFKSNLFEHKSVHTGFTPHACPYCGKTCRLKGNLKKHLRTHVTTKDELEAAWRPFASNRRPPADIPENAIIVRGGGGPYYTPQQQQIRPRRPSARKLGLGNTSNVWTEKIKRGDLLSSPALMGEIERIQNEILGNPTLSIESIIALGKSMPFEQYDCPICKHPFYCRLECSHHIAMEHSHINEGSELFCEKCLRTFSDSASAKQHANYHKRVEDMMNAGALQVQPPPGMVIPSASDLISDMHEHDSMESSMHLALGHELYDDKAYEPCFDETTW